MLVHVVDVVALLTLGGLWGGMAFFAAIYAPLVFTRLEPAVAGNFIRQVFPVYYLAVASGVAALTLALGSTHGPLDAAAMGLVCAGFAVARQALMPRINRARDASLAADDAAARRFDRLHRVSVVVNAVQLVAVLVVLVRFVRV